MCALVTEFRRVHFRSKAAGIDGIAIDIGIAGTEEEWIIISIHEPTVAIEARIKAIGTVKGIAVEARAADLLPAIIDAVIETDHQIGSGRICRADVALLRQFIGNEIGILGKFKAAAELRIISHHGEALPLGGRQLLEARYIGAKGTRAA